MTGRHAPPVADRLRAGCIVNPETGCWDWQRSISNRGYGQIGVGGKVKSAHRVSYETFVGPIPDGLTIDHLCRNKACINPAHMEPVTSRENTHRRPDVHKTHCLRGHELDEANTIIKPRKNGYVIRNCRTCHNAMTRARYYRQMAQVVELPLSRPEEAASEEQAAS